MHEERNACPPISSLFVLFFLFFLCYSLPLERRRRQQIPKTHHKPRRPGPNISLPSLARPTLILPPSSSSSSSPRFFFFFWKQRGANLENVAQRSLSVNSCIADLACARVAKATRCLTRGCGVVRACCFVRGACLVAGSLCFVRPAALPYFIFSFFFVVQKADKFSGA